jgi:hypothetical protein
MEIAGSYRNEATDNLVVGLTLIESQQVLQSRANSCAAPLERLATFGRRWALHVARRNGAALRVYLTPACWKDAPGGRGIAMPFASTMHNQDEGRLHGEPAAGLTLR